MDDDALDSLDQFESAVVAILNGLQGDVSTWSIVKSSGRGAERDAFHFLALAMAPRRELNDLCTHERPSHTAIAIRPANESDIRYVVMLVSFEHEARHSRA